MSVASVMQQAMHVRRIMSCVAFLALPYFSTLSYKRHSYRERVIEQEMCFYFLYDFCPKHFSF
jgi:cytochrome c-type biogenesis protein CcmH/NrfG